MKILPLIILMLGLVSFSAQVTAAELDPPIIVLKMDDLIYRSDGTVFGAGWNRMIQVADERGIPISIGIIGHSLNLNAPAYFEKIRALHDSGKVEFWNHGYTHKRNAETKTYEFRGVDFEAQLDTLSRCQALALQKLGFEFTSFGAPFNANDTQTTLAIREHPEITAWMYGMVDAELLPGQVVLTHSINMEQPVAHPNFEAFKRDFLKKADRKYHVLQGHPGGWDDARFEQFGQILDFLQERGAIFLQPTQLAERLTLN